MHVLLNVYSNVHSNTYVRKPSFSLSKEISQASQDCPVSFKKPEDVSRIKSRNKKLLRFDKPVLHIHSDDEMYRHYALLFL